MLTAQESATQRISVNFNLKKPAAYKAVLFIQDLNSERIQCIQILSYYTQKRKRTSKFNRFISAHMNVQLILDIFLTCQKKVFTNILVAVYPTFHTDKYTVCLGPSEQNTQLYWNCISKVSHFLLQYQVKMSTLG